MIPVYDGPYAAAPVSRFGPVAVRRFRCVRDLCPRWEVECGSLRVGWHPINHPASQRWRVECWLFGGGGIGVFLGKRYLVAEREP